MSDIERILDKLYVLSRVDPERTVFGASTHQYHLNPPLDEDEVQRFEDEHGITLPGDYREFLLQAGDGGAGPYYGLYPLREAASLSDEPSYLARPFPHRFWWNGTDPPNWFDLPDTHLPAPTAESEAAYFAKAHVQGSLRIAHEGCAYYDLLVVSGPERGHVWCDNRASDYGIAPLPYPGGEFRLDGDYLIPANGRRQRLSFLEWYEHWLDKSLASVGA